MKLKLITTETFGTVPCDFYRNMNDDMLLTREQIGQALEYKDPSKAIRKIHLKHKDRLEPLCLRLKLDNNQSGANLSKSEEQERVYYTQRGIMELCRWSRQPKADNFMDWAWDIIESYRNNTLSSQNIDSLVTVILEKPSTSEELDNIKSVVGIVNTNNMTLDEFKSYYKEQIGKECTAAIENGMDVETTLGKKHFSYTIEDQSNVKDLIITAIFTDFTLPLPYHADGELCTLYQPNDIQKIYMLLCSNKTYHTTYCNVLNAMINEAKDLVSVKAITYGMEITDEKYLEVMSKINESKDALLTYVEKKFTLNKSKDLKEESNNE